MTSSLITENDAGPVELRNMLVAMEGRVAEAATPARPVPVVRLGGSWVGEGEGGRGRSQRSRRRHLVYRSFYGDAAR